MAARRRNWAVFYRTQQERARRALALGMHRPDFANREQPAPAPEQNEESPSD